MRLPVVMAHEAVNEGQCLDFLAQPPLWSAEYIEINTRWEVTPSDARQSYSKVIPDC